MSNIFIENDLTKPVDTVGLLSSGIQVYFPLTEYLEVGILFVPPVGRIKIYIQQKALTEDILIQIKVFELHVPITFSLLFFNLGIAHYYSKSFLTILGNLKSDLISNITKQLKNNLEDSLIRIKELDNEIEPDRKR